MKVLLINGSPKPKGNTATALSEVAGALQSEGVETEIITVGNQAIRGCNGCGSCSSNSSHHCIYDDAVNKVIDKLEEADGFVFGSPVYYASPNGTMISFMDRLFYAGSSLMAFKPAASVAVARRGGTSTTFDVLNKYPSINNMPIVSANYWNNVHGRTPGEAAQDVEGLQTMRMLGRNMAWMLKSFAAAELAGITHPQPEAKQQYNFVR